MCKFIVTNILMISKKSDNEFQLFHKLLGHVLNEKQWKSVNDQILFKKLERPVCTFQKDRKGITFWPEKQTKRLQNYIEKSKFQKELRFHMENNPITFWTLHDWGTNKIKSNFHSYQKIQQRWRPEKQILI
jgi:hypothetical protein